MYAVLYAFLLWHSHWENGELLVHCDNEAVVDAINKRSIRSLTITPLQTLLLIAALFNITISAVWIPTASNFIADALSRHDFKRLANLGYKDYNHHNIWNSEPQTPVLTLRQKLLSFSETVLLNPPRRDMTPLSPTTHSSQEPTDIPPSRQHSSQSLTGSPTSSNQSKSKQLKATSTQSRTTTWNTNTPNSRTPSSTKFSKVPNKSTTKIPIDNAFHSQRTSSSKLQPNYALSSSPTTTSTSSQHSVSGSPDSYKLASSPGINGILFHLLNFIYPANTSHSTPSTVLSHSSSPPQKQTHLATGQKSTSHPQAQESAQLQPYTICLNGSHPTAPHHCSTTASAPSQGPILWKTSKPSSFKLASTPQTTQATHCGKGRRFQQVGKEYLKRKSNYSGDRKATQLISTSTKSPNLITKQKS
jgi:hypothetical protein